MELSEKSKPKRKYVRIIIGESESGSTGVKKPIKQITLTGTTVDYVHKKLMEMIEDGNKKSKV